VNAASATVAKPSEHIADTAAQRLKAETITISSNVHATEFAKLATGATPQLRVSSQTISVLCVKNANFKQRFPVFLNSFRGNGVSAMGDGHLPCLIARLQSSRAAHEAEHESRAPNFVGASRRAK
jgi:hypothetical protein